MTVGDSFSITPERLRKSGNDMADLGGRAGGLGTRVVGDPSIWGSDEAGAAFGGAYTELVEAATEALTALADSLATVGENLGVMADNTEAADQAGSDRFGQISGEV
ncbi:MAG: hypothetical protein GEV03_23750 [Streptosporangiales bacterium]|nr:hypothetical protein [Streptosporangiales bacterium]